VTPYVVRFERLDSLPLAVVRRQAQSSELARLVPDSCGLVWDAVRAQQGNAGRHVAVYWDGRIRLEVGVEIHGPFTERGDVVRSATPAGRVVSTTHSGPYRGLGAAHYAIREWCAAGPTALPAQAGRSTVTGDPNGMATRRRSARTCIT
jgi:hypothetical protein